MNEEIENLYKRLDREAEASGYHLNPDTDHTLGLIEGLIKNESRYGYWACPCRLAEGRKDEDLDIICPCDYRDEDLAQYGTCYCGLYVSEHFVKRKVSVPSIPERRPEVREKRRMHRRESRRGVSVWRCRVCGYLCARSEPPEVCPICKARKERFEPFLL